MREIYFKAEAILIFFWRTVVRWFDEKFDPLQFSKPRSKSMKSQYSISTNPKRADWSKLTERSVVGQNLYRTN